MKDYFKVGVWHLKRRGAIPLTSNMKIIYNININKTANALRFFKESKQINLSPYLSFIRFFFYPKSKKFQDLFYKDKSIKIDKHLQNLPCPKKEDISISYPEGFLVCFNNMEQIQKLLYEIKHRNIDKTQKDYIKKLLQDEDGLSPYLDYSGIYLIQNKVNKKRYVGKASSLGSRLLQYSYHPYLISNAASSNIYRAMLKFGHHNFSFSVLEICDNKELSQREQFFINKWAPQYNIIKTVYKPTKPSK